MSDTPTRGLLNPRLHATGEIVAGSAKTYCLPHCSAAGVPTQRHASAAAAEAAGLRPCPHCRPECAPLPVARGAAGRLVRRAAARLAALGTPLTDLPQALGVSRRRLDTAFAACYATSLDQFAATQRRQLALRLLADTMAPHADVARASGYTSVNALERDLGTHYGASGRALRGARTTAQPAGGVSLPVESPYAWPRLLGFLNGRTIGGCEAVEGDGYRRTLRVTVAGDERLGWMDVHCSADALAFTLSDSLVPALPTVLARAWHAFDLGADPRAIGKVLGPLARGEPGLRLPGTFDPFELAVRAILGQQITVKAARTLASRFVAAFGVPIETPYAALSRVFPTPAQVADLAIDAIASLGIIGARTRTILGVARALADGSLVLAPGSDLPTSIAALKNLPGIGEWTAQYIAMRALAAHDAFPHTDYGVMKALDEKNPRRVLALGEQWRPYRAYAVMHLWRSLG